MESQLIRHDIAPAWDDELMRALTRVTAPVTDHCGLLIGVEDDTGRIYRLVRTTGLYETVRLFESARAFGFDIAAGGNTSGQRVQRVLRRVSELRHAA